MLSPGVQLLRMTRTFSFLVAAYLLFEQELVLIASAGEFGFPSL
jgi:hypothetical protein